MGKGRNRKAREDAARKRRDRQRRKALSARLGVTIGPRVPDLQKMSDVLVGFARPLLDAIGADAPPEAIRGTLHLAGAVWNILATVEHEEPSEELAEEMLALLCDGTGLSEDDCFELLTVLSARKAELFPGDPRIVMRVTAERRGSGYHVEALSALYR